jgi:Zn-dependent protease
MEELTLVQKIVVWALPVIFAITVHEVAHGWMARKRGDSTAFFMGRLTLNPLKHIDPIGTVILPGILLLTGTGMIFGWAKPVPVDPRNFKKPKTDMALVALAGPVSNLLMALIWALIARVGVIVNTESVTLPLAYMGMAGISINLVLALINLIPIPPLDGSRIISGVLPSHLLYKYEKIEPYGFYILIGLMYFGILGVILALPMALLHFVFYAIAGL